MGIRCDPVSLKQGLYPVCMRTWTCMCSGRPTIRKKVRRRLSLHQSPAANISSTHICTWKRILIFKMPPWGDSWCVKEALLKYCPVAWFNISWRCQRRWPAVIHALALFLGGDIFFSNTIKAAVYFLCFLHLTRSPGQNQQVVLMLWLISSFSVIKPFYMWGKSKIRMRRNRQGSCSLIWDFEHHITDLFVFDNGTNNLSPWEANKSFVLWELPNWKQVFLQSEACKPSGVTWLQSALQHCWLWSRSSSFSRFTDCMCCRLTKIKYLLFLFNLTSHLAQRGHGHWSLCLHIPHFNKMYVFAEATGDEEGKSDRN